MEIERTLSRSERVSISIPYLRIIVHQLRDLSRHTTTSTSY